MDRSAFASQPSDEDKGARVAWTRGQCRLVRVAAGLAKLIDKSLVISGAASKVKSRTRSATGFPAALLPLSRLPP